MPEWLQVMDVVRFALLLGVLVVLFYIVRKNTQDGKKRVEKLEKFVKKQLGKYIKTSEEDMQDIVTKEITTLDKKWDQRFKSLEKKIDNKLSPK